MSGVDQSESRKTIGCIPRGIRARVGVRFLTLTLTLAMLIYANEMLMSLAVRILEYIIFKIILFRSAGWNKLSSK